MNTNTGDLDALIQEKLDADAEFNTSLDGLSEDDKNQAISTKKAELLNQEFISLREEKKKVETLAENQKIRAERAEREGKKPPKEIIQPTEKKDELSSTDVIAIVNAKVHEDDIEEVTKAAKLLNKSIPEALKDSVVKLILSKKTEERETANAANTNPVRRTTNKVTSDVLLTELSKGNVPEKGSKEAEDIFWARRGGRR